MNRHRHPVRARARPGVRTSCAVALIAKGCLLAIAAVEHMIRSARNFTGASRAMRGVAVFSAVPIQRILPRL